MFNWLCCFIHCCIALINTDMDWREKIDYEIKAKRKDKDEQQLIWGVTIIVVVLILALIA